VQSHCALHYAADDGENFILSSPIKRMFHRARAREGEAEESVCERARKLSALAAAAAAASTRVASLAYRFLAGILESSSAGQAATSSCDLIRPINAQLLEERLE